VVRYLALLSHALTVAMKEWGWIDDNPCRKVTKPKEPRGRVRFLDDREREALLCACRESRNVLLYPMVVLAIATGMRKGEMQQLRWHQVDLDEGRITLEETKNGERRSVPLVGRALAEIRKLACARQLDTHLVFPGANPSKLIEIRAAWSAAVGRSGLRDFKFHDLRHTAASYLAQGGATPIDIASVLGHKTLAMVKRYAHLSESRVRDVLVDMNQRAFGS
jgi:integrase